MSRCWRCGCPVGGRGGALAVDDAGPVGRAGGRDRGRVDRMRCAGAGSARPTARCRSATAARSNGDVRPPVQHGCPCGGARLDGWPPRAARDPRTRNQRRADAMGAWPPERIGWGVAAAGMIARPTKRRHHAGGDSCDRREGQHRRQHAGPGVDDRCRWAVPAELIEELAKSAKLVPLVHPG